MALCSSCESISLPIVTSGQAAQGRTLQQSVARLAASAKACQLCAIFLDAVSEIKLKGIRNNAVQLFSWASDVYGDPVGLSRVFIRVGDKVGRFVDVFTESGSQAANHGFAIGRPVSEQYDFKLYQQWLSNCCLNHSCGTVSHPHADELPARFIKINKGDTIPELLLVSSTDVSSHYAALSYCWGSQLNGVVTTKATLEKHYARIEPSRLSKTVRDATQIIKALGIEYLWVDSPCIIQDDQEDWATESMRMSKLYQSALVTIVASAASNANQGCLFPRNATRDYVGVTLSIPPVKDVSKVVFTSHLSPIADDFRTSPWSKRAWCLQEYVLSPRLLYFFKDRVIWQCREMLTAEDYLVLRREGNFFSDGLRTLNYFSLCPPTDLDSWFGLVEEYSQRSLTKSGDKLIAIAALATYLRPFLGSEYISGIWLKDLHKGLLWISSDSKMQNPPRERAPSWTWAALDGPVSHLHRLQSSSAPQESTIVIRNSTRDEEMGHISAQHMLSLTAYLRKVSRSNSLMKTSEFTQVASTSMKDILFLNRNFQVHCLYEADGSSCGWAVFDQESFAEEELFCLQAAKGNNEGGLHSHYVLVLKPNGMTDRIFERVGVGEIVKLDFFDTAKKTDIILI